MQALGIFEVRQELNDKWGKFEQLEKLYIDSLTLKQLERYRKEMNLSRKCIQDSDDIRAEHVYVFFRPEVVSKSEKKLDLAYEMFEAYFQYSVMDKRSEFKIVA